MRQTFREPLEDGYYAWRHFSFSRTRMNRNRRRMFDCSHAFAQWKIPNLFWVLLYFANFFAGARRCSPRDQPAMGPEKGLAWNDEPLPIPRKRR
jgi:hypothetical protein